MSSPASPTDERPRRSSGSARRARSEDEASSPSLTPLRELTSRLDATVRNSPADQTEIVWLESRQGRVGHGVADAETYERRSTTLQVRVIEGSRPGSYRSGDSSESDAAQAVRHALANATAHAPRRLPRFPASDDPPPRLETFDPLLGELGRRAAIDRLRKLARPDEAVILEWAVALVAVSNSAELRRSVRVTSAFLQVRSGTGIGAGFATDAARFWDDLEAEAVFERARSRRAGELRGQLGVSHALPVVLAPEATATLLELLNHRAFASDAYRQGHSFLRQHRGVQVFNPGLTLRDDGTDPAGLPFPFDLEGQTKRPVLLVDQGVPRTPTLDLRSAAEFGLEPTASCVNDAEAVALNLFMAPGTLPEGELLRLAEGGVWISRLEHIECFDPARVLIRARARGVRRVQAGELTAPLPPLIWEDSLLRVFSDLRGFGRYTARRPSQDGFLGGLRTPAIVIGEASSLRET